MRKLIPLFLTLALGGCAGTNFSYDSARQVTPGMSESDLVSTMGSPYMVVSRPDGQMWAYTYANGLTGSVRTVSFLVRDGRVAQVPSIPESFK